MESFKKIGRFLAPDAEKSQDGRDQWGSRASFILAAMGGAIGLGNLLRYPGQVFGNNGLQWFIPYLIALTMLGIPVLILELSIGQAYRGGCVVAYDHIHKRAKGVGLSIIFNGYSVVLYYVPILSWVMNYFRNSFTSPLPWTGRAEEFFMADVIANPDPIPGSFSETGSGVVDYTRYPAAGIIGETAGWCAFVWFVVWLCMFRGVALTGRVVYFTMGLPLIMGIVFIGRGVSLPNATEGIKLYFAEWHGGKLASGTIWQAACGQIFFSIGVGFGYFTSYASYNPKYANIVQDAFIIACSNCLYEVLVAFSVFGVIGNLGLTPDGTSLGTFTIGFLTYPEAITAMPGANFWAIAFFFTVMLLGISSAFALLEAITTMICDSDWGKRIPRTLVCTVVVVVSFLLSLIYCTEFGFYLLDAVDTWVNYLALFFVVWAECVTATTIYRYKDVVGQVGWPAFLLFNGGYVVATVIGLAVAHTVSPSAGAGTGFGLFIASTIGTAFIARTPDSAPPRFWARNPILSRLWWVAFYSGNQLTRDLNVSVASGKNWAIPSFWAPLLKYISSPILAIIFAFAYPRFYPLRNDPLHIFAFGFMHLAMVIIAAGFIVPRFFDIFVPVARRGEGRLEYAPNVTLGHGELEVREGMEGGHAIKPNGYHKSSMEAAHDSDEFGKERSK